MLIVVLGLSSVVFNMEEKHGELLEQKQWAAVNTYLLLISVPPQEKLLTAPFVVDLDIINKANHGLGLQQSNGWYQE